MNLLMARRRMMEDEWWDYALHPNQNGHITPIAIPVVAGDTIKVKWESALNSLVYRVWALKDGATFAETTKTDLTTYTEKNNDYKVYTVASDGTLILGGFYKAPDSLWSTYALRAHFLGMRFL